MRLLRSFKVLVVNNALPTPYHSYGEMWVDGFKDAGCDVTVWPYESISHIPPRYDLYFFMDIRYDPKNIPWYLNPRVVYSFDSHWTGADYWVEKGQYFDKVLLPTKKEVDEVGAVLGNTLLLREAANPRIHRTITPFDSRPIEVGYIGNSSNNPVRFGLTKDDIMFHIKSSVEYSFVLQIDRGQHATAFGKDSTAAYNNMKLSVDWPLAHNIGTRIFEASACGCCTLRADNDDDNGLKDIFIPYVHYIPFKPSREGLTEALELARENNYAIARSCSQEAYELVMSGHTYAHRCRELISTVCPATQLVEVAE